MSQVMRVKKLPPPVQREVTERLIANGFSDYEELEADLRRRGYRISKSALHRYGQQLSGDADFLRRWALEHPELAAVLAAALKARPNGGLAIKLPAAQIGGAGHE